MGSIKSLLHSAEARSLSNNFVNSKKYVIETKRVIKKIENEIKKASKKGFYTWKDYIKISKNADLNKVADTFQKQGYSIYIKVWCTDVRKYDVYVSWEK